jgi:hypothetical protein
MVSQSYNENVDIVLATIPEALAPKATEWCCCGWQCTALCKLPLGQCFPHFTLLVVASHTGPVTGKDAETVARTLTPGVELFAEVHATSTSGAGMGTLTTTTECTTAEQVTAQIHTFKLFGPLN